MKRFFLTILITLNGFAVSAQGVCEPPVYRFNSMSSSGNGSVNSTYTFSNVLSATNAVITITKVQNASITNNNVDVSSPYPVAWQPFITFTNNRNLNSDTSYIEFKVEFKSTSAGNPLQAQSCMAMTIVDCDGNGNNSYREMVKITLPGTPKGIANSSISVFEDTKWILFKSGTATFNNIDTNNLAAMGQMNFPGNTNTFYMRVGVVGPISGNTTRQFSFYFKGFALPVALPVHLSNFTAKSQDGFIRLNWTASEEFNLKQYEVYRSYDGINYESVAIIQPGVNGKLNQYQWTDYNKTNAQTAFYKLKLLDFDLKSSWSFINTIDLFNRPDANLSVFPNPSDGILQISTDYQGESLDVKVIDVYGKCVYEGSHQLLSDLIELELSGLLSGVYSIQIIADNQVISSAKWLKN